MAMANPFLESLIEPSLLIKLSGAADRSASVMALPRPLHGFGITSQAKEVRNAFREQAGRKLVRIGENLYGRGSWADQRRLRRLEGGAFSLLGDDYLPLEHFYNRLAVRVQDYHEIGTANPETDAIWKDNLEFTVNLLELEPGSTLIKGKHLVVELDPGRRGEREFVPLLDLMDDGGLLAGVFNDVGIVKAIFRRKAEFGAFARAVEGNGGFFGGLALL